MKLKKFFALALAAATLALALTACGSKADDSADNSDANTDNQTGETVTVKKLHGEGAIKRRIMDMGITKGAEVYVRKVAPLGDPIELTVRGYELSLRKADAEKIEVE